MSASAYGTFGEPASGLVKRARRHERLMPKSLQVANFMKYLSNRDIHAFQADVEDLVDPTLHYEENKKEILHHYHVAEKHGRVHEQVKEQCPSAISDCKVEKVEPACEFACEVCKDKKSCSELDVIAGKAPAEAKKKEKKVKKQKEVETAKKVVSPFYESSKEELAEMERKAYEQALKETKGLAPEEVKKKVESVRLTGQLMGVTGTIYQVQRYDAIIRGYEWGAKEEEKKKTVTKKEPWQMTYREFFDIAGSEYTAGERFGVPTKNRMPINPETGYQIKGATPEERIHRAVLMKALKEGKTVSPEVLEDYPELVSKKKLPMISKGVKTKTKPSKDQWQMTREEWKSTNQDHVIGNIYRSTYGEPIHFGDTIQYMTVFGMRHGTLIGAKNIEIVGKPKVEVTVRTPDGKVLALSDAGSYGVRGEKHEKYFDTYLNDPIGYERHGAIVKQALKEGKPVPPEVLKDYPDLKKEQAELFVTIAGHKKHRMRCPICGRAAPDNFCELHGDVKAVDVTKDRRAMEITLDIIKGKEKHAATTVRKIIRDLEKEYGWNVPISEVLDLAEYEGLKRDDAEEAILWMKRDGILFSPGKDEIQFVEKRIPIIPPEAFGLKGKRVPPLPIPPTKKQKKIKYFEKQLTTKQIQAIKKLGHIDITINKVKKRITKKHLVPKKRIQKIKWYPCGKKVCLKKDKIQNSLDGKGKVVKKIARESGASKSYSYQVLKEAKKKGKAKLVDKKPLKYSRRKKRENKK